MYLVFCLVQGKAMLVQTLLHSLEGLLDIAIPLQQLTYKDAHLILEVLQGPPLLLDYPLQLRYLSFGRGQLLSQLCNCPLGDLVHQVIHIGLYSVPL